MTNLLEEAISTDDGSRAAKIIQDALGIESNEVDTIAFPKSGRRIVSNGRGSSVIGCGPRRDFWRDRAPSLPVALERRRKRRLLHCEGSQRPGSCIRVLRRGAWQKGSGQSSDKRRGTKDRRQHCKSAGVATALKARFARF